MASLHFNTLTTEDGEVSRLHVQRNAQHPLSRANSQYSSSVLPLWRFVMQPSLIKTW